MQVTGSGNPKPGPAVESAMGRFVALALVVTLAATACVGGAASAPTRTALSARLVVTYTLGQPKRSVGAVDGTCPPGARCSPQSLPGFTPRKWMLRVQRTLTCGPSGGDYANPGAACRALAALERVLHSKPRFVCSCAITIGIEPSAHGLLDGVTTTVPLDSCTYCNQGSPVQHDLQVLTPGAT